MWIRFALCLAILFILLFASLAQSEQLVSPSGGDQVIVFKTQDMMNYAIKVLATEPPLRPPGASSGNWRVFEPRVFDTIRCIPTSGTEVSVIKSSWLSGSQVRIMNGPHRGKIGWVPSEMIK
jgi:hypothetical protein